MDWARAEALASVVSGLFAAVTFFVTIWPWPQIRQSKEARGNFKGKRVPKLFGALLIISFVFSGLAVYGAWGKETGFKHPPINELELIQGKVFTNETIDMEGKNFEDCTFNNVRLVFHGKKTVAMSHNRFVGPVVLFTDDHGVSAFAELLGAFNVFRTEGVVWKSDATGFSLVTNYADQPTPAPNKQP